MTTETLVVMSVSPTTAIDLTVFDHKQASSDCHDFKRCICIQRILTSLKYYSLLKINSNSSHQTIFNDFIQTIYTVSNLIMDQHHLQKEHCNEVYEIMNYALSEYKVPKCDIKTCLYSSRLYRVQDALSKINIFDKDDTESSLRIAIDIIDGIHHFVFHVFESGLRDNGKNTVRVDQNENNKDVDECYDNEFAKMSQRIASTRTNTERFDRINTSNKFNINIADTKDIANVYNNDGDETYLDSMYSGLLDADIEYTVKIKKHFIALVIIITVRSAYYFD